MAGKPSSQPNETYFDQKLNTSGQLNFLLMNRPVSCDTCEVALGNNTHVYWHMYIHPRQGKSHKMDAHALLCQHESSAVLK